jgi:hypothetical protein
MSEPSRTLFVLMKGTDRKVFKPSRAGVQEWALSNMSECQPHDRVNLCFSLWWKEVLKTLFLFNILQAGKARTLKRAVTSTSSVFQWNFYHCTWHCDSKCGLPTSVLHKTQHWGQIWAFVASSVFLYSFGGWHMVGSLRKTKLNYITVFIPEEEQYCKVTLNKSLFSYFFYS